MTSDTNKNGKARTENRSGDVHVSGVKAVYVKYFASGDVCLFQNYSEDVVD